MRDFPARLPAPDSMCKHAVQKQVMAFAVRYSPELLNVARVIVVPVRENNRWVAKEADSDRVLAGGE